MSQRGKSSQLEEMKKSLETLETKYDNLKEMVSTPPPGKKNYNNNNSDK